MPIGFMRPGLTRIYSYPFSYSRSKVALCHFRLRLVGALTKVKPAFKTSGNARNRHVLPFKLVVIVYNELYRGLETVRFN